MPIQYSSGVIAFLVCAGTLPAVKLFARRFHLYDAPGSLKIHHGSISRLGGIAMMAGLLASLIIFLLPTTRKEALPLVVLMAVWTVGLVDDVKSLPSYFRFAVHIGAGATFWLAGWRPGWFQSATLDLVATCLFVALVINALNLLDGMDGLATGTAATVSLGFLFISAGNSNRTETIVAASLLGVSAGMLTANAPPATIFMGDSGSTLIGIVLAFLSLNWIRIQPAEHSIVVPLIFLSIPLADVALAVLRRTRSRTALFAGDRRHFYDLLLRRGWTVRRVLIVSLGITCLLVLTGWMCARQMLGARVGVSLIVGCVGIFAHSLGSLRPETEQQVREIRHETSLGSVIE
jgi:UDP-GlcNAc:undecaprenyl-phosphate/decaprenyl-phosphate GlcNAc-1-phosphate transferase